MRAPDLVADEQGIRVLTPSGWRTFGAQRPAGPIRARRLWLGTDQQGRDVLARTLRGAQTSLLVAAVATAVALLLGSCIGLAAALSRRARPPLAVLTDGLLGLPRLLLLLMLGVALRELPVALGLAIGLTAWMEIARLVEGQARALRNHPFLHAAEATGMRTSRLAWRHLLPNLAPLLGVAAPLVATEAILLESTLSFLGLSGSDAPSWGRMIADSQARLPDGWWMVVFPGLLLCLTALAVHRLSPAREQTLARVTLPQQSLEAEKRVGQNV